MQTFNKDCIVALEYLIQQDIKVDAIITDPPYEIDYDDWDKELNWPRIFELFCQVTKDTANIIIFQGWSNVCRTLSKVPSSLTLKDWIIYDRIKGRGAKKQLVSTREDILWLTKSDIYTFNKIPSTILKKTGGLGLRNGNKYRALSNVWTDISPIVPWSKERTAHPTQKPVQLMERCIKLWTNENDLVLDPFMGSGSTGVACKMHNRHFIGIDNNIDYYNIAQRRLFNDPTEN